MSTLIVGDLHFGAGSGNKDLLDGLVSFFSRVLIPYIDEHGIETVFILGDVFDSRTAVGVPALNAAKMMFVELNERCDVRVVLGNHDLYYKTTRDMDSVEPVVRGLRRVTVVREPTFFDVGGERFLALPWIVPGEEPALRDADVLLGHLEIRGFEMSGGHVADTGIFAEKLEKYTRVYSGHFHTYQERDNVVYVGSACQLNWGDSGVPKYFAHYLGGGKHRLIENTASPRFVKLTACDDVPEELGRTWVRVTTPPDADEDAVAKWMSRLTAANPDLLSLEVVNPVVSGETSSGVVSAELLSKEILDVISEYVDLIELPKKISKKKLMMIMRTAYAEAEAA